MLAEYEMFEKFGGGETSKQGHAVETISCQANNVGQFRQAFSGIIKVGLHNPILISNFFVYDGKCRRSHNPIFPSNYFVMYSKETRQFLF